MNRRSALYVNWRNTKAGAQFWNKKSKPWGYSVTTLPQGWDFIVLTSPRYDNSKTYLVYLFNSYYYFTLRTPKTITSFAPNRSTGTLFLSQTFFSSAFTHYHTCVRNNMQSVSSIFFLKLKFKGKGYYVYKNLRNTIAPQFGYAHRIYVYAFNISVKFLSKTSILLFGLSKSDLLTVGQNFKSKKPINIFTGRGVRFSRQIIYKKTGKVSSYR